MFRNRLSYTSTALCHYFCYNYYHYCIYYCLVTTTATVLSTTTISTTLRSHCQTIIWPHPSSSLNSALVANSVPHSVQNLNYLLHFCLWHSPPRIVLIFFNPTLQPDNCNPQQISVCLSLLVWTQKTIDGRSSFRISPSARYHPPQTLHYSDSASSFKSAPQTHLFKHYHTLFFKPSFHHCVHPFHP